MLFPNYVADVLNRGGIMRRIAALVAATILFGGTGILLGHITFAAWRGLGLG